MTSLIYSRLAFQSYGSPLIFVSAGAGQDCDFSGDVRRNPASEEVERNIKKVRCTKKKRAGKHKWQRNNDGRNERRKLALVRRHSVCATYSSLSASILIDRTCTLGESKQQFAIGDESRRLVMLHVCRYCYRGRSSPLERYWTGFYAGYSDLAHQAGHPGSHLGDSRLLVDKSVCCIRPQLTTLSVSSSKQSLKPKYFGTVGKRCTDNIDEVPGVNRTGSYSEELNLVPR